MVAESGCDDVFKPQIVIPALNKSNFFTNRYPQRVNSDSQTITTIIFAIATERGIQQGAESILAP